MCFSGRKQTMIHPCMAALLNNKKNELLVHIISMGLKGIMMTLKSQFQKVMFKSYF